MTETKFEQLYEAAKQSLRDQEHELMALRQRVAQLELQGKQWEIERMNQNGIIQHALNNSNEYVQQVLQENAELKRELQTLRGL